MAKSWQRPEATSRLPFLDALRGVLACVVVANHGLLVFGNVALAAAAGTAVLVFFAMSGYVLARAYDGRALPFAARRVVRLWPTYAACLVVAHGLQGGFPSVGELSWLPSGLPRSIAADLPTWSLYAEAWATPVFPLAFAVPGRIAPVVLALASVALVVLWPVLFPVPAFLIGIAASRFDINWPARIPSPLLWLGKVSFSLYLTHQILFMAFGVWGLALVLPVAWATWRFIERPSITLSRRIGAR